MGWSTGAKSTEPAEKKVWMLEEMVKPRHSVDERLRINPGGGTAEWNGPRSNAQRRSSSSRFEARGRSPLESCWCTHAPVASPEH